VIVFLCDIKISAVHHLVLSHVTHGTDRWTDRITNPKTTLAYACVVKTSSILNFICSFMNVIMVLQKTAQRDVKGHNIIWCSGKLHGHRLICDVINCLSINHGRYIKISPILNYARWAHS